MLAVAAPLLALVVAGSPAAASGSLVGQWHFDEGAGTAAADSSGYGNNGTLAGSVAWVAGRFGSALQFNGAPGDVQVPDSPSLDPASGITVSAWVRSAGSPGTYRYVVAKGADACIAASYGLYTGPSGGLEFYVSREHGTVYARSPDAGTGVWDGNWHLAVGTFDGTTIRLYVDGTQVASGTAYPGPIEYPLSSSNDLFLGDYPGCATHTFVGDIDEVSIWDQALTAGEISAMMQGTPPPTTTIGGGSGSGSGSGAGSRDGSGAGSGGGGGPTGSSGGARSAPQLRLLRLTPARFAAAQGGRSQVKGGSVFSYRDTRAAHAQFKVLVAEPGVRQRGRCVKVPRQGRKDHLKSCTRYSVVGSFVHADVAGVNRFPFTGRVDGRALSPGNYVLSGSATTRGTTGRTVSASFTIVR